MATMKRGLQGIKTMAALVDGRRTRSSAGALLELSTLENEKQRLQQELDRGRRRHAEIKARLAEIAVKEKRLYEFVKRPKRSAVSSKPADDGLPRLKAVEINY